MSIETQSRVIETVRSIENTMMGMGFTPALPLQEGFATWFSFRKSTCEVRFVCGPPEYHMEMFIKMDKSSGAKTYELADLMQIPTLAQWIRTNRPVDQGHDHLGAESRWFIDLLKIALPELDAQC